MVSSPSGDCFNYGFLRVITRGGGFVERQIKCLLSNRKIIYCSNLGFYVSQAQITLPPILHSCT